jgi:hypothetical protein
VASSASKQVNPPSVIRQEARDSSLTEQELVVARRMLVLHMLHCVMKSAFLRTIQCYPSLNETYLDFFQFSCCL